MVLIVAEDRKEEAGVEIEVVLAVIKGVETVDFVEVDKVDNTGNVEGSESEPGPLMTGITTVSIGCEGLTIEINGVTVEAIVNNTVVVTAGSLITTVDVIVCENVSNTLFDTVIVSTLSELCIIVLVTVAGG